MGSKTGLRGRGWSLSVQRSRIAPSPPLSSNLGAAAIAIGDRRNGTLRIAVRFDRCERIWVSVIARRDATVSGSLAVKPLEYATLNPDDSRPDKEPERPAVVMSTLMTDQSAPKTVSSDGAAIVVEYRALVAGRENARVHRRELSNSAGRDH
jgi:hypothetical protein